MFDTKGILPQRGEDCKKQPVDCCSAEGWEELGRERLDTTKRVVLERRVNRRIPSSGPIDYNHQQYLDDVKKRELTDKRGYNYGI